MLVNLGQCYKPTRISLTENLVLIIQYLGINSLINQPQLSKYTNSIPCKPTAQLISCHVRLHTGMLSPSAYYSPTYPVAPTLPTFHPPLAVSSLNINTTKTTVHPPSFSQAILSHHALILVSI